MNLFEFHISRKARQKYQFDESLFTTDGNIIFTNFSAARLLAEQMSAQRPEPVPASDINAMGLLGEIFHVVIQKFDELTPQLRERALVWIRTQVDQSTLDDSLIRFTEEYPPVQVFRGEMSPEQFLSLETETSTLEEMLLLQLARRNPALQPYQELFEGEVLPETSQYKKVIEKIDTFFDQQQVPREFEVTSDSLLQVLQAPANASPDSLDGQLEYIIDHWEAFLGEALIERLRRALDYLNEESLRTTGDGGFSGKAPLLEFHDQPDYERFTEDSEWMPRVVLLAKNTYVWLEQLSRKYGRWIRLLNEIPDEELDILAQRGFTGLWLIGLWERSRASQRIKQRMGDPEAVASAYSLYSYDIAVDLGGWPALENLRARAWSRGIRLSADMVPNHMGIDSRWIMEHPDWFLSLPQPPYPNYRFESENLSDDSRAAIVLEDHYYDHSDAAVVFKLHHYRTDRTRYVYHGNDGTSMPWNDTAQLDYSQAEVREAVIQTILHVARNFPIIRFDAAMTLAKKHIQRLWFPEPGAGGAIPSRSEHGMSRSEFQAALPNEFWREVVDRVSAEVPDTLLLAEAFWLMEGYFVRTLGMHRVYNSAFMHMLRDEDNAKYRQVIKNVLEFDPQVLKRFVNFMNNPDEKTAVEQFGSGDKYFGVCTLLATLPGLPMFGHGQIEGFHEKYGMEFRHPKLDEGVDEGLVRGHEWKIFPLLHRRHLFAGSENFLLYDFYTADGHVNEDVFAFSNLHQDERGLIIHNNKFTETSGWLKTSAAYVDKASGDLRQKSLAEGLGLPFEGYVIYKDYSTQLEYIRSCEELWSRGLYLQLDAYQHHAFLDWRLVVDKKWQAVHDALRGAGVSSVQQKWDELFAVQEKEAQPTVKETGKKKGKKKVRRKGKNTTRRSSGKKK